MEDEDYSDRVVRAMMQSSYYKNDEAKEMAVGVLRMFMDIFDYDGFYSAYDISEAEYSKYFKITVQKYSENWHKFAMQEFERERKYNNENI